MTPRQLEILQHSIGADQYGKRKQDDTRNHFCAGPCDAVICRELVVLGYMFERQASELTGGDPLFHVTGSGINAVLRESPAPPKLTRGQKRYAKFLAADCDMSFGEWLKYYDKAVAQ